jgi:hypothetical protein
MIVLKCHEKSYQKGIRYYNEKWRGYYLFGFIPLYLVRYEFTSRLV